MTTFIHGMDHEEAAQHRVIRQLSRTDKIASTIRLGFRKTEQLARATLRVLPNPAMQ